MMYVELPSSVSGNVLMFTFAQKIIAPILADIVINNVKEEILRQIEFQTIRHYGYVDDTVVIYTNDMHLEDLW